jgi:hypothetical protein
MNDYGFIACNFALCLIVCTGMAVGYFERSEKNLHELAMKELELKYGYKDGLQESTQ